MTTVPVADEEAGHRKMVELLESGAADAAVTMHFPFPIGVSTVGRVVTPARGKSMFLATTTGTSSANRLEGMILNAIYGIITAKACGIQEPTVGILNVDGARACETALRQLQQAGYPIRFAESVRADGGAVMRGQRCASGDPRRDGVRLPDGQRAHQDAQLLYHRRQLRVHRLRLWPRHRPGL